MCVKISRCTATVAVYSMVESVLCAVLNIVLALYMTQTVVVKEDKNNFWQDISQYDDCENAPAYMYDNNILQQLACQSVCSYEYVYITLNILWAIASIVLLAKSSLRCGYVFWMVAAGASIVMDTYTGIVFFIDYFGDGSSDYQYKLVMALISFRGFIFYILNIAAFVLMIIVMITTKKNKPKDKVKNNKPNNSDDGQTNEITSEATLNRETNTIPRNYENDNYYDGPKELSLAKIPYLSKAAVEPTSSLQFNQHRPQIHQTQTGVEMRQTGHDQRAYHYNNQRRSSRQSSQYGRRKYGYQAEVNRSPSYDHDGDAFDSDNEYYDNFESVPPPKVPARVHRRQSQEATSLTQQPQIPEEDYNKKAPKMKGISYDSRPFSYLNPNFRPDHLDVESMKTHSTDIIETLNQETEQLKSKRNASMSESEKSNAHNSSKRMHNYAFHPDQPGYHPSSSSMDLPDQRSYGNKDIYQTPPEYDAAPHDSTKVFITAV